MAIKYGENQEKNRGWLMTCAKMKIFGQISIFGSAP
jgi:hypothetical protein